MRQKYDLFSIRPNGVNSIVTLNQNDKFEKDDMIAKMIPTNVLLWIG